MTAPTPSGGLSPLRVGGLVLLGVAVVAGIIGLATLFNGDGQGGSSTAAPGPSNSVTGTVEPSPGATPTDAAPTDATPTAAPTSEGPVPLPSFPTPTDGGAAPTDVAAPPATEPGSSAGDGIGLAGGGAGGGGAVVRAPLRVYNNSTISGLAAHAADEFRRAGWTVEEVANYPSGTIPTSTVYYRPGTGEQAAAKVLGDEFGLRVEPRFEGLTGASPGLIVIVTNDFQRR